MQYLSKVNFLALIALTVFLCTFLGNELRRRLWPTRGQTLLKIISAPTESKKDAYLDLTGEFEQAADNSTESFNVFRAIKQDGYLLTLMSDIESTHDEFQIDGATEDGSSADNLSHLSPAEFQSQNLKVPNVVHYVYTGAGLRFTFVNYLSYRSAGRYIRPDQIFVHGDHPPTGPWWDRTVREVRDIYHVKTIPSETAPNGKAYHFPAHISDFMRTEILLRYGGIYLDPDVLVVKSFTPLRRYSVVMGLEAPGRLCNGIMLGVRGAPFLRLLLEQYHSYKGEEEAWAEKSVENTHKLAELYPHLIHIEETSLDRPSWFETDLMFNQVYNWSQNYAVHLFIRMWPNEKKPTGPEDILTARTTLGQLARRIMFGSFEIKSNLSEAIRSPHIAQGH